ncbi:NfeD family protein [Verrucomicrobiales bacterium BCK34]|nr:NfeD family protein [Verrucomicrobiales bacterium BCK34]
MTTILLLSAIGIVAILAELVLPGGVLGVVGFLCLVGAVVATFTTYGATWGLVALFGLIVLCLLTLNLWMKFFHRLPFTRSLVLNEEVGQDDELEERQNLIGRTGIALTDLHPSGRAEIGGTRIDVISEGEQIEKGKEIVVISTSGPSIFVREIEEE